MVVLYILGTIYLVGGLVYAVYILLNKINPWYSFPINMLFGPIIFAWSYYKFMIKKEVPH